MNAPEHDAHENERDRTYETNAGEIHARIRTLSRIDIECPHCATLTPALDWRTNAIALVCPNCDALTYAGATLTVRFR